ncbi:helix-turn-helix domain-containing protein [Cerasibacillus sp. JNUCC 74]
MDLLDFLFFSKRAKNQFIPNHIHNCYELVYYYTSGITEIASVEYSFHENTFALISPNVEHNEIHYSNADVLFIGFHSDSEAIVNLNGVFQDSSDWTIKRTLQKMKDEFMQRQDRFSEMLNLLVGELVIHLQRLIGSTKSHNQIEERILYVRNYMDEYFRQKLSVKTLASIAGYSYDRFRHLFKEKFGIAPLQYLYLKRINYAKECLIKDPSMLVSEIALEAGFVNDSQFCNVFKRETGLTPTLFRKNYLK